MLTNLLVYRLLIVNAFGFVLLAFAWQRGLVAEVMAGDTTGLVYVMAALFILFLVSLFNRAGKVSANLNRTKGGAAPIPINKTKFLAKQAHLDEIPGWLVTIGLLGTVIGMSMAIFGIDQSSLGSPEGVKRVASGLIAGMQVALYTTIVGSILGLWASVNRRILRTATLVMIEDVRGGMV